MHELKRIDPISLAKIYGIIGVIIGFIAGVIIAIVGISFGLASAGVQQAMGFGLMPFVGFMALLAIIIMPIVYGIIMFICGLVGAVIYNIIAGRFGGVMIELKGSDTRPVSVQATRKTKSK